jgi:RND family efflux transporter MFP subunit
MRGLQHLFAALVLKPVKTLLTWVVVLAVLGAGGFYGWTWWQKQLAETQKNGPVSIPTATVGRQTIELNVEISGDLEPVEVLEVKSEVSAKIKKLHVELGQTVKQGDLLAELDNTELLTERSQIQIEIEGANLELKKAEEDLARDERLYERQLIPERDVAERRNARDLAANRLERARKRMQTLEDRLAKTTITAPMNGIILEMPVVEGQVVIAAASVNSGTMMMKLANLSQLLIKTHVNQVDVARLREGMDVKFTVDSIPGAVMAGKVFRIAPTATIKNNIKGFQVEIRIADPDPRLRPGMTADVVIPVAKAEDVLAVPISAVFNEPGDRKVVFLQGPDPQPRPVEVGLSNIHFVEIKSGLNENDVVLLARPPMKKGG